MGDIANRSDPAAPAPAVSKVEDAVIDRSSTSATSTPDPEHEREPGPEAEAEVPEQPQQQKRKGGRKPVSNPSPLPLPNFKSLWKGAMSGPAVLTGKRKKIYATSEERKQRNRQAQAAFRERRTEYIKQLEQTIKLHEETLQNLQQSHRSAADECLMLRYKNSLLERILLEKGKQKSRNPFFFASPL